MRLSILKSKPARLISGLKMKKNRPIKLIWQIKSRLISRWSKRWYKNKNRLPSLCFMANNRTKRLRMDKIQKGNGMNNNKWMMLLKLIINRIPQPCRFQLGPEWWKWLTISVIQLKMELIKIKLISYLRRAIILIMVILIVTNRSFNNQGLIQKQNYKKWKKNFWIMSMLTFSLQKVKDCIKGS